MPNLRYKVSRLDVAIAMPVFVVAAYAGYRVVFGLDYHWQWDVIPQYLVRFDPDGQRWTSSLLLQGFFTTIRLSIWATVLAVGIGFVLGLFSVSERLLLRLISRGYVELIRNLPPLVLIFIFYYFISDQILSHVGLDAWARSAPEALQQGMRLFMSPPRHMVAFVSAVITLAVFEGAYITEIVRAGIESVDRGQREAAFAMGFTRGQTMGHVILPQALPPILPPLAGQLISTIKDSAIVSVISIQDLTFQGLELMSATYLTFEIWIVITVMYLLLTLSCSAAVQYIESIVNKRFEQTS